MAQRENAEEYGVPVDNQPTGHQETDDLTGRIPPTSSHSLGQEITSRLPSAHKGDVGGPAPANEDVYQGSKDVEILPDQED